jgi:hypothetical protein
MTNSDGESYLAHYEQYLGQPVDRQIFEAAGRERSIQVLAFDNVFSGCRVFCSLGLSHYEQQVQGTAEIVVPIDDGWRSVPSVLANALFFAIERQMPLDRGVGIAGIERIQPEFAKTFGKAAIYFTHTIGFPDGFEMISSNGVSGRVLMGVFITLGEYQFFQDRGCDNLESLFQKSGIDPFNVKRPSVI